MSRSALPSGSRFSFQCTTHRQASITGYFAILRIRATFTTVVSLLMADSSLPHGPADRNLTIVLLASSCVLIGGITQMLLGFFKMGNLIKYIPHPVSAGFLNGIAILLIWKQLPLLLGLDRNATLLEVLSNVSLVNLSSLVIGAAALGAVFVSKIFLKLVPSILFGLLTDAVVYSILLLLTDKSRHVAVIGELAFTLPTIGIVTELFH
jgi:MFS superfamily sulfate permease-like transporter